MSRYFVRIPTKWIHEQKLAFLTTRSGVLELKTYFALIVLKGHYQGRMRSEEKSFPATLDDISEYAHISRPHAAAGLRLLRKRGLIKRGLKNWRRARVGHRTAFYELVGPECKRATNVVEAVHVGGFALAMLDASSVDARNLFSSPAPVEGATREGAAAICARSEAERIELPGCSAPVRVTLLPIGGVARFRTMPEQPGQELAVALAGPAVNVAIAALLVGVFGVEPGAPVLSGDLRPDQILPALAGINLFLALFNLVPAFPMDGGRVLRALLAMTLERERATRLAPRWGQAVGGALGHPRLCGRNRSPGRGRKNGPGRSASGTWASGGPSGASVVSALRRWPSGSWWEFSSRAKIASGAARASRSSGSRSRAFLKKVTARSLLPSRSS